MAAPPFVPVDPVAQPRSYESPDYVPPVWMPTRPGELTGRQPSGDHRGYQGPDQGFGLLLASRFRDRIQVTGRETVDDAVVGCLGVALRRASIFGRAPMIHDFTIAFTIWGFLDAHPPSELVELRSALFENVAHVAQHYAEARTIADSVPESTLRSSHQQVTAKYPAAWRELLGR